MLAKMYEQEKMQLKTLVPKLTTKKSMSYISRILTPISSYGDDSDAKPKMEIANLNDDDDFKNSVLESFYSEGMEEELPQLERDKRTKTLNSPEKKFSTKNTLKFEKNSELADIEEGEGSVEENSRKNGSNRECTNEDTQETQEKKQ